MDDATLLRVTQWRKRLERAGWTGVRRARPPRGRVIEYHLVWRGRLVTGGVRLADQREEDWWQPGTPLYLFTRGLDVVDGVWRVARDQGAQAGQVCRRLPA